MLCSSPHQRQEAERLQRHRLAAGVRTGDDQRPIAEAVAEPQVDRDRARSQERMPGAEQLDGVVAARGAHPVRLRPEPGPRQPQVGARQRVK
jgi:hypothetical protein